MARTRVGIVTRTLGWIVAACLLAAYLLKPSPDDLIDRREKDAIRVTDSVYVTATDTLIEVRRHTDSVLVAVTDTLLQIIPLADTLIHRDTVVQILGRERRACDAVVSACEARVKARDVRIATLERRNGGWLVLYGDMGVSAPIPTFRGLTVDGEAGVALRLDRQTQIQLGATTRGEARISVRRQITLF
jgi:hypothetical protein